MAAAAKGKKRDRDELPTPVKYPKKPRLSIERGHDFRQPPNSTLTNDEVDFPRGGGSAFTPAELKAIRSEAVREADEEAVVEVGERLFESRY